MPANRRSFRGLPIFALCVAAVGADQGVHAQPVLTPWGNLTGIRVDGAPVDFEAGLRIVLPDWSGFDAAVKYRQRPRYRHDGNRRVVESRVEDLSFTATVEDLDEGRASFQLQLEAEREGAMAGAYLCFDFPETEFAEGTIELRTPDGDAVKPASLTGPPVRGATGPLRGRVSSARVRTRQGDLDVEFALPAASYTTLLHPGPR